MEQVADLLHGKEEDVYADSGYCGAPSRVNRDDRQWHIAARPRNIAKMPEWRAKTRGRKEEHRKASIRGRIQPVDATIWLNISAGVWKPRVFLGLSFNCLATALSLAYEIA